MGSRGAGTSGRPGTFYTLAVTLFYIWVLGLIDVVSLGALVHLVLATAVLCLVVGLMEGSGTMT